MFTHRLTLAAKVLVVAICLACALSAFANDQQKAEKRLNQISAMAADPAARAIINRTMAELVHAKRVELQRQRQAMDLNYGELFVAHQLHAGGMPMLDLAMQLQSGETVMQVANDRHANWKLIADGAKKFEDRVEDNIYRHFQHPEADQPAADEKYNPETDIVAADGKFSAEELSTAREVFVFWRNRAAAPRGKSLDTSTQTVLGKSQDSLDRGDRRQ